MDDLDRTVSASENQPTAIASLSLATVSFALSRGLTFEALEGATGLARSDLISPDKRLPDDAVPRLWRLISSTAHPNEVPSLAMARSAPFSYLGGLVEGAQFAATAGEALCFFVENQTFVAERLALEIHFSPHEDHFAFSASHPADTLDGGRTAEVGTGFSLRALSMILGTDVVPRRVEYGHAPGGPPEVYERYFRAPAAFDQPRTQVIFHRALLDAPVQHANLELFRHLQHHFRLVREGLEDTKTPAALRELRRTIVENANGGDYRAGAAAARLGLSVRSAQRLATAHGRTLSAMIEEVRQSNAKRFLADPSISLASVALLVGYSDDRAFRRAFKAWTGQTPSGYRRQKNESS
ncbi:MAG: AraC family transcriptional regulator ligand-binding domain-containing protein [Pseudomonadota bacterium]